MNNYPSFFSNEADMSLPSYILPDNFSFIPGNPIPYKNSDAILGIYYNVLYPEESQINEQNTLSAWLQNGENHAFPFNEKKFSRTSPFFLGRTPINVFESLFAEKTLELLEKGFVLDSAFNKAMSFIKKNIVPLYKIKSEILLEKMLKNDKPLIRKRYEILFQSIENCCNDPEKELSYSKQSYIDHKDDEIFYSLLEGSILKGKKQALPKSNRWDHRIIALKEAIDKIIKFAPKSPYFLALQEVTPQSLEDLKEKFPDLNWISYNTTSAKETSSDGDEKILGEFLSFTATLGISKELQVVRQAHQTLPSVSGSLRRILGVEVYHKTQKRKFAIFTIHTDYLVQENLYERNVQCISEFVHEFAPDLPFICGGDLNAFESNGGNEYIENLKKSAPFEGTIDYREGPFYSAPQIAFSTFLGHALDSFKAPLIEHEGTLTVQPNALDHIFLNGLHLVYSIREAAVYDEKGHIIDPFTEQEAFVEGIRNRKTVSDHFLNAVLFSL